MKRAKKTPTDTMPADNTTEKPKCGLIMPISAIDGLPAAHWEDVKSILSEAIDAVGFEPDLVSAAEESTIIHRTIVHNLYNNPIVVCDVSGKNPNVMFELGIRLTFDRPTVVVKDDKTDYSFDSSPIEHLVYPRDLRFNQIVKFKETLSGKIKATYEKAAKDPNYSTFLKYFGEFTVPKLEQKEVSPDQFIIKRLEEMADAISRLERQSYKQPRLGPRRLFEFPLENLTEADRMYMRQFATLLFPHVEARVRGDTLVVLVPGAEYSELDIDRLVLGITREVELRSKRFGEVSDDDSDTESVEVEQDSETAQ